MELRLAGKHLSALSLAAGRTASSFLPCVLDPLLSRLPGSPGAFVTVLSISAMCARERSPGACSSDPGSVAAVSPLGTHSFDSAGVSWRSGWPEPSIPCLSLLVLHAGQTGVPVVVVLTFSCL